MPLTVAGCAAELDVAAPLITNEQGGLRSTDIDGATWIATRTGSGFWNADQLPNIAEHERKQPSTLIAEPRAFVLQPNNTPEHPGTLTALPVDTAPALDSTAERHSTDRGVRVVRDRFVRRLTPRECERLQSFPDDWTLIPSQACPDTRRYGALGNAVTVNVAEWIGRRIMAEHLLAEEGL